MTISDLAHRVSTKVVDDFWLWAARLGRLHPKAKPSLHGVELVRDIAYAPGGSEHLLDVYRPAGGGGPWPALLYVHGGGFRILSKDSHWVMGLALASVGYTVFNINYRLAPTHPFPAALEDVRQAYGWLLEHAPGFGGDPGRVVLAGESAGANLVTALTVALCYRREEPWGRACWELGVVPRAVLPACGLLQVSDCARFGRRVKRRRGRWAARVAGVATRPMLRWIHEHLEEVETSYLGKTGLSAEAQALASPLLVLERGAPPDRPLPPFFASAGTWDPLLDDTRRLKAALDRLGAPCEARYYPRQLHAFHAFVWREPARQCWRDIYDFLDEQVGPSPLRRARR
jgi:acetyl esterase